MGDSKGFNSYISFEQGEQDFESQYSGCKEKDKPSAFTGPKKGFDCMDYSCTNTNKIVRSKRSGFCIKRKAQWEDLAMYFVIQPPSLKKPKGHELKSGQAICRVRCGQVIESPVLHSGWRPVQGCNGGKHCAESSIQTAFANGLVKGKAEGSKDPPGHIVGMEVLNQTFLTSEAKHGVTREGRLSMKVGLQCLVQLFESCSNFTVQSLDVLSSVSMVPSPCRDSSQRFIDGDMSDLEDEEKDGDKDEEKSNEVDANNDGEREREEDKEDKGEVDKENEEDEVKEVEEEENEDKEEGEGEEEEEDKDENDDDDDEEEEQEEEEEKEEGDSEVHSTVCTLSALPSKQIRDSGVISECRSQQSDDMYHGQEGISSEIFGGKIFFSTNEHSKRSSSSSRGHNIDHETNVNVDTSGYSVCQLPMSDGRLHESPCLQSVVVDASGQTSSDTSRDLYTAGSVYYSRQQTTPYGSPCPHPVVDAGWQTSSDISRDPYTDGSASQNRLQTPHASPLLHPIAVDTCQQTSSDASRDFCVSPKQLPQHGGIKLRIKLPKEEEALSTVEEGIVEEVLSNSKEETPVKQLPGTAKALLSSGLLDGCRVYYQYRGSGIMLTGVVKDGGILCDCRTCKGRTIVNVSSFEKHAGSNARHPSDYIFLENGKSLHEIIKTGWQTSQGMYVGRVRKATITADEGNESSLRSVSSRSVATHRKKDLSLNAESLSSVGYHQRRSDSNSLRSLHTPQLSQTRDGSRHKMLFLPGGLPDGTEVAYYVKGQCFLTGKKKGHGICCGCCNEVISCSQFEAHAGWASRRNAYLSMFLSNGQSLHEFALALAAKDQKSTDINNSRDNDDYCAECGDGGDLVLCDACPGAYHAECVGLCSIPAGDWCCPHCEDKKQQPWKKSARGSGRVHSMLTREKLSQRCQRVVKASRNTIGGCVFCKNGDFLKSGFGAKTIMLCDQCEREYHVGCMKEKGVADLQELPAGEWFCCADCNHIHNVLEGLVSNGPEPVHIRICSILLEKRRQRTVAGQVNPQDCEFTWQLLHGRRGDPQNGRTLSEAASIFTESFDPIVDATSGRDLISLMVYSRSIRDQDFRGMYCAVLKWKEEVISAAVIRIFGRQFAEMPLVATASACRGQGYFQMLMSSIEQLLRVLQVEHLVLPAAEGAEGIWTNKFGFSKLHDGQLQQFGSEVQMMIFQGSSMLFKAMS